MPCKGIIDEYIRRLTQPKIITITVVKISSLCGFELKTLPPLGQVSAANQGALEQYTCQCVLPINLFNEKIFGVLWFYVAALLPLTVYSTLIWLFRSSQTSRRSFVR